MSTENISTTLERCFGVVNTALNLFNKVKQCRAWLVLVSVTTEKDQPFETKRRW